MGGQGEERTRFSTPGCLCLLFKPPWGSVPTQEQLPNEETEAGMSPVQGETAPPLQPGQDAQVLENFPQLSSGLSQASNLPTSWEPEATRGTPSLRRGEPASGRPRAG